MQLTQFRNLVVAAALMALLAGCVGTPPALPYKEEREVEGRTFSFDNDTYPAKNELFPRYHIVPGDLLDILFQISPTQSMKRFTLGIDHQLIVKFINMPEMNETQNVQPDGRITLPYIGEVYVVGMSIDELTAELKERYKTIFRDPELYVIVPEFSTAIKQLKEDLHTAPRGLSRLVTVRPDGYATFPVIGDVFVAGRTIPEADLELDKLYANRMPGLQVDLFWNRHRALSCSLWGRLLRLARIKLKNQFPCSKPLPWRVDIRMMPDWTTLLCSVVRTIAKLLPGG